MLVFCALGMGPAIADIPLANITTITARANHTCAVTTGGGVKCWGQNDYGQIGDGTIINRFTPVDVAGLTSGMSAVAAGWNHTCALTSGGGVKCWGDNTNGQLGDGTTTQRFTAVDVAGLTSGVQAISAGAYHTCALTSGGGIKCWGLNDDGELGDATFTQRLTPVDAFGLTSGLTAIAAGAYHSCARTTGGGVWCWGQNGLGQLGEGTHNGSPTGAVVLGMASGIAAITAGAYYTCAVTIGGGARCWGGNYSGQLGDGSTNDSSSPVNVVGLASGVSSIAASNPINDDDDGHTCALMVGGGVKCWGSNEVGQIGDGTTADRMTPVDVAGLGGTAASIALGGYHTCARFNTGGVKCWGLNGSGQLGDNTPLQRTLAVDVQGLANGITAVAAGGGHSCARTSAGGVKCWGFNTLAQLGDGTTRRRLSVADVVGLASGITAIAPGQFHTCARTSGGGVKCWGFNLSGALGDGTTTLRSTPVDVVGLAGGVAAITAGAYYTCALTTGGGVKCWGLNADGQLGDGTTTDRLTAVDVSGLASGVIAIDAGERHTCALTSGGAVKCWGYNGQGGLGDGTTTSRLTPVNVTGLASGVAGIAAGSLHTCARTIGGGVKCWGWNGFGQIGDGTVTGRTTAVDVVGLASGVVAIDMGGQHSCALTSAGGVKCWGDNSYAQLGDGTMINHATPLDVAGLTSGVAGIALGVVHSCVLTSGGGIKCWGDNSEGALGNGEAGYRILPFPVVVQGTLTPTVVTNAASGVVSIAATLNGTVTSNGATTTVTFDYGLTTGYGNTITAAQSPLASGALSTPVSAAITGLACSTTYHFRVVGANVGGTVNGNDLTFTTVGCIVFPPTVATNAASGVTATGATLNGTVSSKGTTTTVTFQFGVTTSYGGAATAAQSPLAAGATNAAVSAAIGGLACNTTYHFRAVGANGGGTTNGADVSLATAACASPPTVTTNAASGVTTTGATLNGTVSSNGAATAVTFQYGLTTSYGSTVTAPQSPLKASDVNSSVSALIGGLTCNTTYHFRAVGANGATINGADGTFTTAACAAQLPTVTTNPASAITTTGATLNGAVSSNGTSTSVSIRYGLTTIYGNTASIAASPLSAGASNVTVSAAIGGLTCNTVYHFRVVGMNTAGTTNGTDRSFTTSACAGTSTRLEIAPSAPLTYVSTVLSNGSGKVHFTDRYFPDTQLMNYACPAVPTGLVGGSCDALSSCTQATLDVQGHAFCVPDISCLAQQQGCHYITATYEGGSDPSSTSAELAYPVIPPPPANVNSATGGNGDAEVDFAPTENGGLPITGYTVTARPESGTGNVVVTTVVPTVGVDRHAGSLATTHVVAGLSNGVAYVFEVVATNQLGASPTSSPSNGVVPIASSISAYSRNYVQKVYVAYYGRPADPAGQDYWASLMDTKGQALDAIIAAFGTSDEFNRRYGGLTSAQLITRTYQQTLGRDPDPTGLAYYVGELQAGNRTLQTITLDVLNGATTAPDATVVSHRLEVADHYTAKVAAGCVYGGEKAGVDALATVDADAASVVVAKALIDAHCGGN